IVPSHFVPLAAPGMVREALRHMGDRESPFYMAPRLSADLLRWAWLFRRAATAAHVTKAAPLLRDMHFASRALYRDWHREWKGGFDLTLRGLVMLCKTEHALEDEARAAMEARRLGMPAEVLGPRELAELDPEIRMDVAGGVYFPDDAHLT